MLYNARMTFSNMFPIISNRYIHSHIW